MTYSPEQFLDLAVVAARRSPCAKSQRGVVIWNPTVGVVATGWNAPPAPLTCSGSVHCRQHCNKLCVHAEAHALLRVERGALLSKTCEMLHVKVVDGVAVPSGPPSCWQCSRLILQAGIRQMWLLHEDGLRAYSAEEFHRKTLEHHGLLEPAVKEPLTDELVQHLRKVTPIKVKMTKVEIRDSSSDPTLRMEYTSSDGTKIPHTIRLHRFREPKDT